MSSNEESSTAKEKSKDDDAKLPAGWTRGWSRSQKRWFYCHAATKTSQWHPPTAAEALDPAKAKQACEQRARAEQNSGSSKNSGSSGSKSKKRESSSTGGGGLGSIVDSVCLKKARSSGVEKKRVSNSVDGALALADSTDVAIIVPYRDLHPEQHRAQHLDRFVPYMTSFLQKQVEKGSVSDFHVYIVEQSDDGRKFNRGKLLNIGFDLAKKRHRDHDVFIFHDVDLLPNDDLASWYSTFPKSPIHIARVWNRYSNNPKYFGGIVSFSSSDMRRINGYPNTFWGWGGEDDEMQKRCERLSIKWEHPAKGTVTDLEQMSIKQKLDFLRANKAWKCQVKWECLNEHQQTWRANGLSDLNYQLLNTNNLDPTTSKATKYTVDVKLNGNHWANDKCALDFIGY